MKKVILVVREVSRVRFNVPLIDELLSAAKRAVLGEKVEVLDPAKLDGRVHPPVSAKAEAVNPWQVIVSGDTNVAAAKEQRLLRRQQERERRRGIDIIRRAVQAHRGH